MQRGESRPRCWYCKTSLGRLIRYTALDATMGLPAGTGVVICEPKCPDLPDDTPVMVRRGKESTP